MSLVASLLLIFCFLSISLYIFYVPVNLEIVVVMIIIMFAILPLLNSVNSLLIKSKVSESFTLMAGARNSATVYYASHGQWPETQDLVGIKTEGLYSENLQVQQGTIVSRFKDEALQNMTLSLRTAFPQDYPLFLLSTCGYREFPMTVDYQGEQQTTVPEAYLPFLCRQGV